jgi:hypothetical protein
MLRRDRMMAGGESAMMHSTHHDKQQGILGRPPNTQQSNYDGDMRGEKTTMTL